MNDVLRFIEGRVTSAGGKAYLVGGAVIDRLQGREIKDLDVEVLGLPLLRLHELFTDCAPNIVGAAFGVLKLRVHGEDVDINVSRTERRTGSGHRDFEVTCDASLTVREAARRRDFTINAISVDLQTGAVVDPWGGLIDLEAGVLRAVDPTTFVEDPLRALRAMQLLARKAKTVDSATLALIQSLAPEFDSLPAERVFEEFRKLMLKAERPSVGLEFLRESGWLTHFPELEALIGCEQNPDWHPEGDVWVHSCMAADAAASVRHLVAEDQREAFMFGAWLHDLGKPSTTVTQTMIEQGLFPQDRWLTAHGHDKAGRPLAETFMRRMTNETALVERVVELVGAHMRPSYMVAGKSGRGAWIRLARDLNAAGTNLRVLARLCQCDACASQPGRSIAADGVSSWEHRTSAECFNVADTLEATPALTQPVVLGRHLIERGVKPGPAMGKLVAAALELQLSDESDGLTREQILDRILKETP